jgi:hypothetical protein
VHTYLDNVKKAFGGTWNPLNPKFRWGFWNYDGTLTSSLHSSRQMHGQLARTNSTGTGILDHIYKNQEPHNLHMHGKILWGFPGLPSQKGSRYNMMYDAFTKVYPEGLPQRRRVG